MSKGRRKVEWSLDLENMRVRAGQFVTDALGERAEAKRATLREERKGAAAADIRIAFPVGRTTVSALEAGSPLLFQAELAYIGEYEYEVSGGAERIISLRQKGKAPGALAAMTRDEQELYCDIALARGLPLRLQLAGGVGESDIDLSQLLAERLRLETGVGTVKLTTPQLDAGFAVDIIGGVGMTDIVIPGAGKGRLNITGGLGGVSVSVARAAAVSLSATTGLGQISAPAGVKRVEGKGKGGGIWRTAAFEQAPDPVFIDYKGGIGRFSLEFFEVL